MSLKEEINSLSNSQLDFIEDIFKRGVLEGTKHSSPSPETLERLNKIEDTLKEITDNFIKHSNIRDEHIQTMMEEFREGMKDVKTITSLLNNSSFMLKFFIGAGGFLTFILTTYLLIKNLFYGQN